MNYEPFYMLIRSLQDQKITREQFMAEWELCQRRQGLNSPENAKKI